jgi:selenocysteine lyase/cysteine desulfurase
MISTARQRVGHFHARFSLSVSPVCRSNLEAVPDLNEYIGNAQQFPVLRQWDFFNHAGVAPVCKAATDAMRAYADQAESSAYLGRNWYLDLEKLRVSAGQMIGGHRDEIAFLKNTSEGISAVAFGLDWQWGDVIVTTAVEYPANIYPWMEVARAHGAKLVLVPEETDSNGRRAVPLEKILEAASDPRCKLVSLSHVEFASGQRHDVARVGQFCRDNGKLFCVDAIQTMGIIPIDVRAMKIDYLAADGHKWLLGPEGAGVFYCRRELLERTRPLMVGWLNVIDPQDFGNYNYILKSDAGRFECGTYNIPGLLGLKASLELLLTLGVEAVGMRIQHLTDRIVDGATSRGYQVVSPRDASQWSGGVSFTSPKHPHDAIVRELRKQRKIEIAHREGRLRASPHFYNTDEQIDRLIAALPEH